MNHFLEYGRTWKGWDYVCGLLQYIKYKKTNEKKENGNTWIMYKIWIESAKPIEKSSPLYQSYTPTVIIKS